MLAKYEKILNLADQRRKQDKKLFDKLKKKKPKNLDQVVHNLHDEVFELINCLECANCCTTLGPRILERDIERIARYLGMSFDAVISNYLRIDEDQDYVFKTMPCPFLLTDNHCSIYEFRPKACREYPHTDRRKFHQVLSITQKNALVCPAVAEIVGLMHDEFEK